MKIKKIAAALVAAVMVVMTMAMTVSATVFTEAKNVDSGKKVTKTLELDKSMYYKITPNQKGTAKIKVTAETRSFYFNVYDADGNEIKVTDNISMGEKNAKNGYEYNWDGNAETFKGTLSFDVKAKKTYYIQITWHKCWAPKEGTGKFDISFSYPTNETADDTPLMSVTVKKGGTIQLGSTASGTATWSTSNKSVATVSSKGVVKGVKAGKAVITLKSGSKSQKIQVIVTA